MSTDKPRPVIEVAGADPDLDQQLSDHLSEFNQQATPGTAPAAELTVKVRDASGDLAGGISGWTWGDAAGMGLVWVRADHRGAGVGARLLAAFESEAASRLPVGRRADARARRRALPEGPGMSPTDHAPK